MAEGLDKYRVERGTEGFFRSLFMENTSSRRSYLVTLRIEGETTGVPTISPDDHSSFDLLRDDGERLRIPLSAVENAQLLEPHDDRYWMTKAIELSELCTPEDAKPRPKVGAVLVDQGQAVATGFRGEIKPGEHAEFTILGKRLVSRAVAGATLYTTLEPCVSRGEGKVECAQRIIDRRIDRVVIGILDPNPEIRGEGVWRLREAGIKVALCDPDLMAQIEDICREFVRAHRK